MLLVLNVILKGILKEYLLKLVNLSGLNHKLQNFLLRWSFLEIYKSFIRPYQDYNNIIYYKAFIGYSQQKLEYTPHNTDLAIAETI